MHVNLLKSFFRDSTMKIIPTSAAKASSVKRVKYLQIVLIAIALRCKDVLQVCYLTMADRSKATIRRQKNVAHSPIQSRMVK